MTASTCHSLDEFRKTLNLKSAVNFTTSEKLMGIEIEGQSMQMRGVQILPKGVGMQIRGKQKSGMMLERSNDSVKFSE
ncbi:MAG TPA: hypothetical protein VFD97_09005 [Acidimicrobiia bacterium]|nr:hypothetical protein [Acidimicrobiia bacterium]